MKTLLSAEEYLNTPFASPTPDFLDGEVLERAMPNTFHSLVIGFLIESVLKEASGRLFCCPELRICVTPNRYRIVDLAIFDRRPAEAVPELAPLVAIEVLSPQDSYSELMHRFADYASLGIAHIWLVDPEDRRLSRYHEGSLTASGLIEIPEHGLVLGPPDIFRT